jgi:hypothetical protein
VNSWLLGILARALEPSERQAVLGDIAESGQRIFPALRDLLGLIIRRQVALWAHWQPWLALLGIGGLTAFPLSRIVFRFNVSFGQQLNAHRKYGVHFGTGLTAGQDIAFLICLAVALIVWSWVSGFVLGSLSGRAVWITWSVFYLVVLDEAWLRFVLSGNIILRDPQPFWLFLTSTLPLSIAGLLSSVPALCGALLGVRRRTLPSRRAWLLAGTVAVLTILMTWMSGWYETAHEIWSGGTWPAVSLMATLLPFLLVGWPAAWLCVKTQAPLSNPASSSAPDIP